MSEKGAAMKLSHVTPILNVSDVPAGSFGSSSSFEYDAPRRLNEWRILDERSDRGWPLFFIRS